jgi:hypothetical protein
MTWKKSLTVFSIGLVLITAGACLKHRSQPQVTIQIPAGFNGDFLLEMGVKDAPALVKRGDSYIVTVPMNGKLSTSTLLANPQTVFVNASEGGVWGYSQSVFTTGDGIQVGGKIEFFVGTKQGYEAEENKKNHSSGFQIPTEPFTGA